MINKKGFGLTEHDKWTKKTLPVKVTDIYNVRKQHSVLKD